MATTDLAEWALYLALMGWHVFPLRPNSKTPTGHREADCPRTGRCTGGHRTPEQRATTDLELIRAGWQDTPWNIGVATGPSRLLVIDLDTPKHPGSPDGAAGLAELAATRGVTLPDTYTVATPSGGSHLYYRIPDGVHLRNTKSVLAAAVDTRAEGGYVVGPGSVLPAGGYELADDTEPAELPAWILQALCEHHTPKQQNAPVTVHSSTYGKVALAGECDRVRNAEPGHHNETLVSAAYRIGQLIGAGQLDHHSAHTTLTDAAQTLITGNCGCTPREIERVITAGLHKGQSNPRALAAKSQAA
ncbi:bifunctional DNA primase/polymerase [Sciscionella marina]|uniref:bifunctional DNA primase/polymerase n=1 Tax=Sciscionella marina TaxID=508770 RepID=UPI000371C031|nr:bifunctional DNA primase/polymerase [Sciscionella marina]